MPRGHQQAEGAQYARIARHQHARDLEPRRHLAGVQWPGPAKGNQRKIARVVSPGDGHPAQRAVDVDVGYVEDAQRGTLRRQAHPFGQRQRVGKSK